MLDTDVASAPDSRHRGQEPAHTKRKWIGLALVATLALAAVLGRLVEAPDVIHIAQQGVREAGWWAPVAFGATYVGATLLGFPGTPLTLACALLFGFWKALLIMVSATTVSSTAAFLVGRWLARGTVEGWMKGNEKFDVAKRHVEARPWVAIPFLRVMPFFPYSVNNYGLSLTSVPFWVYLLASELAMVPSNALLVGSANSLYRMTVRGETPWTMLGATVGAGLAIAGLGWLGKRTQGSSPGSTNG